MGKHRKIETRELVYNKEIIFSILGTQWGIIIMPDKIIIDNYHGKGVHIHHKPERKIMQKDTKFKDPVKIYNIVKSHVKRNKDLIIDELIEEL